LIILEKVRVQARQLVQAAQAPLQVQVLVLHQVQVHRPAQVVRIQAQALRPVLQQVQVVLVHRQAQARQVLQPVPAQVHRVLQQVQVVPAQAVPAQAHQQAQVAHRLQLELLFGDNVRQLNRFLREDFKIIGLVVLLMERVQMNF